MKRTEDTTGKRRNFTSEHHLQLGMVNTWRYAVSYKAMSIIFFAFELTDGRSISSIPVPNKEVPGRMKGKLTKAEKRRREIIGAARELFQTKDYDKATMRDLMETLNIAKGTIYHHFSSKQELLEAVVEDIVDEELARKVALMASNSVRNLDAMEKLKILIQENSLAYENDRILSNLHHAENIELHTRQLGRYISRLAPLYASVFEQGCREGVFNTDYPLECAEFILAGAQFLTDMGFYPWNQAQLARRMKAMPFLVAAQLGALAGSFNFLNEMNKDQR